MVPRRAKCGGLIVVLLAAVAGIVVPEARSAGEAPPFRSRADLVALDVTVQNRTGESVDGLTPDDFLVLEDGVPQKVEFFSQGGSLPLAVALLIDRSQSMTGAALADAKLAASVFLRDLRGDDLVEVLAFNDLPDRIYALGGDHAAAGQAIEDLSPCGTTRLYDTVLVALRDLERARRARTLEYQDAIVILSDGEDSHSLQSFDDVLEDAERGTASIDAVSLRIDLDNKPLPPVFELVQLATETGGQAIAVKRPADLVSVYDNLASVLRSRYRIGYVSSSPNADGRWRRVSLRVRNGDLVVRTRAGYFAPRAPEGS